MKTYKSFTWIICLAVLLIINSTGVSANTDEQVFDAPVDMSEAEDCISLRGIKKTEILSNRVILFYTRGKKVFQNTLPRRCPGLNKDSIISYTVRMNRLCHYDDITVLRDTGASLSAGFNCSLGKFQPVPNLDQLLGLE